MPKKRHEWGKARYILTKLSEFGRKRNYFGTEMIPFFLSILVFLSIFRNHLLNNETMYLIKRS